VISADSPGDTAEDLEASRAMRDGTAPAEEKPAVKVMQSEDGEEATPPPPVVEQKGLKELGSTLVERAKDVTFLISQALEGKCALEAEVLLALVVHRLTPHRCHALIKAKPIHSGPARSASGRGGAVARCRAHRYRRA